MSSLSEAEAFDYQGHLVFNGIFETEFSSGTETPMENDFYEAEARLSDELPAYNPAERASDSGYEKILLRDLISDHENIREELKSNSKSLITYRYQYEERSTEEAYVDGELRNVDVPGRKDADLYWHHPDYLFIRGAEGDAEEAVGTTRRALSGLVTLRPINFDKDFLLWLFYKKVEEEEISSDLSIRSFEDSELTGDRDAFGGTNTVENSSDLASSVPLLAGILRNKSLSMIQGNFEIVDRTLKAEIQEDKVYIKASYGTIRRSDDVRRHAISLKFLKGLIDLYNHWDGLADNDKYPPFSFFQQLYQSCLEQDVDIQEISNEVLREYATKRGEDPSDWGV